MENYKKFDILYINGASIQITLEFCLVNHLISLISAVNANNK